MALFFHCISARSEDITSLVILSQDFTALAQDGALIAVVSMIRRGSVIVSFVFGALLLHEKNLKSKALDVLLILVGLFFLYLGSR